MEAANKPKTRKGKKVLEARKPKLLEGIRSTIFLKGKKTNEVVTGFSHNLYTLKKLNSVNLTKRFEYKPFEEPGNLESLCNKNDAAIFVYASHSKKRPNNFILGRMFDEQILDMVEFGIEDFIDMNDFKSSNKLLFNSKPAIIFEGDLFEYDPIHQRIKNMFLDLFCENNPMKTLDIKKGFNQAVVLTCTDNNTIVFRSYIVNQKPEGAASKGDKTGDAQADEHPVDLEEVGPRATLAIRRNKLANEDGYKLAVKQPKQKKENQLHKNINKDKIGHTRGRLYVNRQDLAALALRKVKKLKTMGQLNAMRAVDGEEQTVGDLEDDDTAHVQQE